MVSEAKRVGLPEINAYSALAKFLNAYYYVDMSMRLGDLPLTEAQKGLNNVQPKYESLDDMSTKMLKGEYSAISKSKYYSTYTGEPAIQIGYIEQCFNIAEAINRGWISGNAEDFYTKGIQASWLFHGTSVSANWTAYYAQLNVKYKGNNNDGLNQILTQKYLGFFRNSGWEAYNNYRRTGIPVFLTGPGTANSGRIAKRWQYPSSERATNADNYQVSLQSQFGNQNDDINSGMWIIK